MSGSRTIRVLKRDGSIEAFDVWKLAGAMGRAMAAVGMGQENARQLARAIEIYICRSGRPAISSAAVLEMSLKVLGRVRLDEAAAAMESHNARRSARREQVRVRHQDGTVTYWDKTWLCQLARQSWQLSIAAARIIAGQVEAKVLDGAETLIERRVVLRHLNDAVSAFGLADAVRIAHHVASP